MVGNGVTNWQYDGLYSSLLPLAYSVGLIDNSTYQQILYDCVSPGTNNCQASTNILENNMANIDIYDLYGDCYHQRPAPVAPRGVPPCTDASKATNFLNNATVKEAIHVKESITWTICSPLLNYSEDILSLPGGMMPIYLELIEKGIHILVYSGDTDGAVPHTGTQKWIKALGIPTKKRVWDAWVYPKWDGQQTGGYVTEYQGLTYATVHGSGHMVPQFRPEAAYYMFSRFLTGRPL